MKSILDAIKDRWENANVFETDEDGANCVAHELARLIETPILPGSVWLHAKGGYYRVLHVGTLEEDLTPVVIYQTLSMAQLQDIWVRPVQHFLDRFAPCGTNHREPSAQESDAA